MYNIQQELEQFGSEIKKSKYKKKRFTFKLNCIDVSLIILITFNIKK